jgi:hypothetical protein
MRGTSNTCVACSEGLTPGRRLFAGGEFALTIRCRGREHRSARRDAPSVLAYLAGCLARRARLGPGTAALVVYFDFGSPDGVGYCLRPLVHALLDDQLLLYAPACSRPPARPSRWPRSCAPGRFSLPVTARSTGRRSTLTCSWRKLTCSWTGVSTRVIELQELRSVEDQLVQALPRMVELVEHPGLRRALELHHTETKSQRDRLDELLRKHNAGTRKHQDGSMQTILREGERWAKMVKDRDCRDAGRRPSASSTTRSLFTGPSQHGRASSDCMTTRVSCTRSSGRRSAQTKSLASLRSKP